MLAKGQMVKLFKNKTTVEEYLMEFKDTDSTLSTRLRELDPRCMLGWEPQDMLGWEPQEDN